MHLKQETFSYPVRFHRNSFVACANADPVRTCPKGNGLKALEAFINSQRGVIVATSRSLEIPSRPFEGPCDDAADAMLPVQELSRNLAHTIKLGNRNDAFMCGNLKHAVARRIHNRVTGSHVLLAQFLDDFSPRSGLVPHGFAANLFLERVYDFRRKAVLVDGEGVTGVCSKIKKAP